jgi:afadin
MGLLRKCRVNAALTIQLFSQLFHFVNMWTFNTIVTDPQPGQNKVNYCTHKWGLRLKRRLAKVEIWAEKQGLELAADCHLARITQAAHLLQARKGTAEDIATLSSTCFKLNSFQLKSLLSRYQPAENEPPINNELIDTIVRVAQNTVDELTKGEGRQVRLEEDFVLQLPFLLPEESQGDCWSSSLLYKKQDFV